MFFDNILDRLVTRSLPPLVLTQAVRRPRVHLDAAAVAAAYNRGDSLEEIARRLGAPPETVRQAAIRGGALMRRLGRTVGGPHNGRRLTEDQHRAIVADYQRGLTLRTTARVHGCSHQGVVYVLKAAGVPRRSKGRRPVAP